jgi:hypothetical protein
MLAAPALIDRSMTNYWAGVSGNGNIKNIMNIMIVVSEKGRKGGRGASSTIRQV